MRESRAVLEGAVSRTVEGMGYEFVEIEYLQGGLVRVTIDSEKEGGITVDDCEAVSNQVSALLLAEDFNYERLEISSPGIERPLKKASDWRRFAGEAAHVELYEPMRRDGFPEAGRRKLDGRIISVEGGRGLEVVRFEYTGRKPFRTPSEAAREKIREKKTGRAKAAPEPVEVEFPLSLVERAHLIAELDFGGHK